jgi:hypothetical protein
MTAKGGYVAGLLLGWSCKVEEESRRRREIIWGR